MFVECNLSNCQFELLPYIWAVNDVLELTDRKSLANFLFLSHFLSLSLSEDELLENIFDVPIKRRNCTNRGSALSIIIKILVSNGVGSVQAELQVQC